MALAHLGVTEGISNLSTERSPQGIYCRLFYLTVIQQVLSEIPWPFATKVANLSLVGSSGTPGLLGNNYYGSVAPLPNPAPVAVTAGQTIGNVIGITPQGQNADATEFGYTYAYPSDCLQLRRILSFTRNDSSRTRTPYRIMQVNGVQVIATDMPNAMAEYTADIEDLNLAGPDFVMALSLALATAIAPGLTKGDPLGLGQKTMQKYMLMISQAQASALNEEQPDRRPESDFILGRF